MGPAFETRPEWMVSKEILAVLRVRRPFRCWFFDLPGRTFMNDNKKKVVVVDDHPLFRERLAQLINYQPDMEVTGEAESTKDAIQVIQNTSPDLAIIDITLKGSSGLELIK